MVTIGSEQEMQEEVSDFIPLTALQAQRLREQSPSLSPWWVVAGQVVMGLVVVLVAWAVTGESSVAMSAGWGALCVVVPAIVFLRGLARQRHAATVGVALGGFFVWEIVKVILSIALLFAAPKLVADLSWLTLLTSYVVTMKVYWVAMWLHSRRFMSVVKI